MNGERRPGPPEGLRAFVRGVFRRDRVTAQVAIGLVGVICQVRGDHVTDDNDSNLQSDVWDKINYGGVKWVSDLYVGTPGSNSGLFSSTVWGST